MMNEMTVRELIKSGSEHLLSQQFTCRCVARRQAKAERYAEIIAKNGPLAGRAVKEKREPEYKNK